MRRRYLLIPALLALVFTWWAHRGVQHDDEIFANGEALTGRIVSIASVPPSSDRLIEFELPGGARGTTRVDQDMAKRYAVGRSINVHRTDHGTYADDSLNADAWFQRAIVVDLGVAAGVVVVLLASRRRTQS